MLLHEALKALITRMGDDELIIGHRNSEWTGIGPVMEEDIAFSSMAQDKIGHAWALYRMLREELGGIDPDQFAFMRTEKDYRCCHLVEMPIGAYDFSLMRHFLFDHAEAVRYNSLLQSSFTPLQLLARKVKGELKYHTLHADAWVMQLCKAGEESYIKMQAALNDCFQLACGIFEPGLEDGLLVEEKVFPGEASLFEQWQESIYPVLVKSALEMPERKQPVYGGRSGQHTPYLQPLLDEMSEVFRMNPAATW